MGGVWRPRFNHLLLLAIGLFGLARTTATELPAVGLWLQAGVEGGIPTGLPVIARVTPADDLQAAIDAAPATGGIIALAAGRYRLTTTLHLRSGVVLRGTGPRTTVLDLALRSTRPADLRQPAPAWQTSLSPLIPRCPGHPTQAPPHKSGSTILPGRPTCMSFPFCSTTRGIAGW